MRLMPYGCQLGGFDPSGPDVVVVNSSRPAKPPGEHFATSAHSATLGRKRGSLVSANEPALDHMSVTAPSLEPFRSIATGTLGMAGSLVIGRATNLDYVKTATIVP